MRPGDNVAVLCRNHRWFIVASIACSRLGAHALYLNTSFAGPQITEVCDREGATAIVCDAEFAPAIALAAEGRAVFLADTPARARPGRWPSPLWPSSSPGVRVTRYHRPTKPDAR